MTGGYWHFFFDITEIVHEGENLLQVVVRDLSDTSYYARGKQSLERGGMWYTPQSGIWQTVWMEYVPDHYIETINLLPDPDSGCLNVRVKMHDAQRLPLKLTVCLKGDVILNAEGMTEDTCRIGLPSCELWTPENPVLYDIIVRTEEAWLTSGVLWMNLRKSTALITPERPLLSPVTQNIIPGLPWICI